MNKGISGAMSASQIELVKGLKDRIQFFPIPGSEAFNRLSPDKQQLAIKYYEEEDLRTRALEAKYLKTR